MGKTPITKDTEYQALKESCVLLFELSISMGFSRPEANARIVAALREELAAEELRAPGRARSTVKTLVGDCIEAFSGHRGADLEQVDRQLHDQGLPTLSDLRRRFGMSINAVLRRGSIRNDNEYYAVRNVTEDPAFAEHAPTLWALLQAYEERG